jgi:Family of unknown function (DUF6515)
MQSKFFRASVWVLLFGLMCNVIPLDSNAQKKPAGVTKPAARPGTSTKPANKPSVSKPSTQKIESNKPSTKGVQTKGDNRGEGGKISGNEVNIDNSRGDVNINIDNSKDIKVRNEKNTVVRKNNINTYHRPPYYWGGHRYYCYHPYHYHPYRPFYWGPVWHPWGFFVATLAATAIIVSVNNAQYHYDQGMWYEPNNGGYTVVQAPVGGTVTTIPSGHETVVVNNTTNYYYGGAYYEKDGKGYTVVPPPAGAVVENLPEGGQEVKIGEQTYVKIGETYYQPVEMDGKSKYEVVQVEEGS